MGNYLDRWVKFPHSAQVREGSKKKGVQVTWNWITPLSQPLMDP